MGGVDQEEEAAGREQRGWDASLDPVLIPRWELGKSAFL